VSTSCCRASKVSECSLERIWFFFWRINFKQKKQKNS
jgi:hypothetical protein